MEIRTTEERRAEQQALIEKEERRAEQQALLEKMRLEKEHLVSVKKRSNAQRQREYRERARKELARIDMRIDFSANRKLEDIAEYYTVTKKEMLEKLILQAHDAWLEEIGSQAYGEFVEKKNGEN